MKQRMRSVIARFKNNKGGVDEIIGALLGTFMLIMVTFVILDGLGGFVHQQMLQSYVDQYSLTVAKEGCTSNSATQQRYDELKQATGISPTIQVETTYYDASKSRVQYGTEIKITLTVADRAIGIMKSYPVQRKVSRSVISMKYWK